MSEPSLDQYTHMSKNICGEDQPLKRNKCGQWNKWNGERWVGVNYVTDVQQKPIKKEDYLNI